MITKFTTFAKPYILWVTKTLQNKSEQLLIIHIYIANQVKSKWSGKNIKQKYTIFQAKT